MQERSAGGPVVASPPMETVLPRDPRIRATLAEILNQNHNCQSGPVQFGAHHSMFVAARAAPSHRSVMPCHQQQRAVPIVADA
jgi:hypothetical protein